MSMALTPDETFGVLNARLDAQDVTLAAILAQATKTNGRVSKLEQDQAIDAAVKLAMSQRRLAVSHWMKAVIIAATSSIVGSFAYLIFNHT